MIAIGVYHKAEWTHTHTHTHAVTLDNSHIPNKQLAKKLSCLGHLPGVKQPLSWIDGNLYNIMMPQEYPRHHVKPSIHPLGHDNVILLISVTGPDYIARLSLSLYIWLTLYKYYKWVLNSVIKILVSGIMILP